MSMSREPHDPFEKIRKSLDLMDVTRRFDVSRHLDMTRQFDVTRRRLFQAGLPEDRIARLVENAKRQVMPMDKVTQLTGRGMFGPSLAERMLGTGGWRTIVEAERFRKQFEDTLEKTRRVIEVWREEFRRTLPPNWQALDEAEIEVAGDIMERTGWSLAWTPPADVVRKVVAAENDEARKVLLLAEEARVMVDLDRLLAERVTVPELADVRAAAVEGLETYRGGQWRAAQALAAATITTAVHDSLGLRDFVQVRRELKKMHPDEMDFRDLRLALVMTAARKALDRHHFDRLPANFNRMASSHWVKAPQYSPVNALTALMLLVSLAVELDAVTRELAASEESEAA